jgi:flavodoxin I
MDIAIVYGSTFGDTADAAGFVARELGARLGRPPPCLDIASTDLERLVGVDVLVVGCSTWHVGELQADWEAAFARLVTLDWSGTRVALFGHGDQATYPDTFVDALGILADAFEARGATLFGAWPSAGYDHACSRAQRGDRFVGLPLDADGQADLSTARIARWCAALVAELEDAARAEAVPP